MTGLKHGPLGGQDLSKLTGRSVLLCPVWGIVTFERFDDSKRRGFVLLYPGRYRLMVPARMIYLGEWSDDTRTVILAPEGGWERNPVPGRMVRVRFRGGSVAEDISGEWHWLFSRDRTDTSDIVAFSLIEDAKPEDQRSEWAKDSDSAMGVSAKPEVQVTHSMPQAEYDRLATGSGETLSSTGVGDNAKPSDYEECAADQGVAERENEIIAYAMCLFQAFVGGSASRDVRNGTMTKAQADSWKVHAIRQHEESLRELAGVPALAEKGAGQ